MAEITDDGDDGELFGPPMEMTGECAIIDAAMGPGDMSVGLGTMAGLPPSEVGG